MCLTAVVAPRSERQGRAPLAAHGAAVEGETHPWNLAPHPCAMEAVRVITGRTKPSKTFGFSPNFHRGIGSFDLSMLSMMMTKTLPFNRLSCLSPQYMHLSEYCFSRCSSVWQ